LPIKHNISIIPAARTTKQHFASTKTFTSIQPFGFLPSALLPIELHHPALSPSRLLSHLYSSQLTSLPDFTNKPMIIYAPCVYGYAFEVNNGQNFAKYHTPHGDFSFTNIEPFHAERSPTMGYRARNYGC
jgi:hypothetical protein